jgi:hypothetical protein
VSGLAVLSGKRFALTRAGQEALSEPPDRTLRALWRAWTDTDAEDELLRTTAARRVVERQGEKLTRPSERRRVILTALSESPPGRWVHVDALLSYMIASRYEFRVSRPKWSHRGPAPVEAESTLDAYVRRPVEARFVLCFLFEYAATLGLLDVAYVQPAFVRDDRSAVPGGGNSDFLSRYDGFVWYRLNAFGAYCLGLTDAYTPPERQGDSRPLRVLANLDVAVTGAPLSAGDQLLLEQYAARASEAVWKLDSTRLLAAIEAGHTVAELGKFLRANGGELPRTVAQFLDDHESRARRITPRGMAYLVECADPYLLQLIVRDPGTSRYCLQAGERHIVIRPDDEVAFRKALRQLGYVVPGGLIQPADPVSSTGKKRSR